MASKLHNRALIQKIGIVLLSGLLFVAAVMGTYVVTVSPSAIRNPEIEHHHFRMQIVVDGENVDFSEQKFQVSYEPDQCSGELTAEPIHFHDNQDQFVHIHWANITGGLVLKNYGWNYVGGVNDLLGYRFDDFGKIQAVPIHGDVIPKPNESARMFVYIGDASGYTQKDFQDFTQDDLETFFGVESNFPAQDPGHSDETAAEALVRINNLLGNVVIFAQEQEPTQEQIAERFNNLVPLTDSTCGG